MNPKEVKKLLEICFHTKASCVNEVLDRVKGNIRQPSNHSSIIVVQAVDSPLTLQHLPFIRTRVPVLHYKKILKQDAPSQLLNDSDYMTDLKKRNTQKKD